MKNPHYVFLYFQWVSFWIKPEAAPARVTLGVTSLLTLSTQHAKSQASLPPVSYLKAVDAFMSVCTVFVFMALMEYCLVNIVLGDSDPPKPNPKPHPPPKMDRFFDFNAPGKNGKRGSKSLENSETTTVNTFQRQVKILTFRRNNMHIHSIFQHYRKVPCCYHRFRTYRPSLRHHVSRHRPFRSSPRHKYG